MCSRPSLQAVREGIFAMTDGANMPSEMLDLNYQQQISEELFMYYPHKIKEFRVFNANSATAMSWSLIKRILREALVRSLILDSCIDCLGLDMDNVRSLSDIFFQPTQEASCDRFIASKPNPLYLGQRQCKVHELSLALLTFFETCSEAGIEVGTEADPGAGIGVRVLAAGNS